MPSSSKPRRGKMAHQRLTLLLDKSPAPVSFHHAMRELNITRPGMEKVTRTFTDYFRVIKHACEECGRDERYVELTDKGVMHAAEILDRYPGGIEQIEEMIAKPLEPERELGYDLSHSRRG